MSNFLLLYSAGLQYKMMHIIIFSGPAAMIIDRLVPG